MVSLSSKTRYAALNKIFKTFEAWIERKSVLSEFICNEHYLLQSLKGSGHLRKRVYKSEMGIIDSLKTNDEAIKELLAAEFRSQLTI